LRRDKRRGDERPRPRAGRGASPGTPERSD
jgi:hypothetical protein